MPTKSSHGPKPIQKSSSATLARAPWAEPTAPLASEGGGLLFGILRSNTMTCGTAPVLMCLSPTLRVLNIQTFSPEQQRARRDSFFWCPKTDLKIRIPVLVLYLGDNSKKHWYGSGKTERKMIKGEFPSQLPQRAILWELQRQCRAPSELSRPRGKKLGHVSHALSIIGQSCFQNINFIALLAGPELKPSISHDQKKLSQVSAVSSLWSMEVNIKMMWWGGGGTNSICSKRKQKHQCQNQKAR